MLSRSPDCCRAAEARQGYVPTELVAAYRELVRLHTQLSDEAAGYQNEIHALLVVQFPEFSQVFMDPSRPTALALLKRYPSPQAILQAGVETLADMLNELSPSHYGRATAEHLVALA
jgi:transposase